MADRIAQLEKMLAAEPNDPFCLYSMAQEQAKLGQLQAAVQYYDRTIASDPNYCYAYFHKARAQEQMGDLDGAIATLREGLIHAQRAGDAKAAGEIEAYLETLT